MILSMAGIFPAIDHYYRAGRVPVCCSFKIAGGDKIAGSWASKEHSGHWWGAVRLALRSDVAARIQCQC